MYANSRIQFIPEYGAVIAITSSILLAVSRTIIVLKCGPSVERGTRRVKYLSLKSQTIDGHFWSCAKFSHIAKGAGDSGDFETDNPLS